MTTTFAQKLPPSPPPPYAPPHPYTPASRRLRVLLISHTCQSATEGQPKAQALGHLPDIDLHLLIPSRWNHYGSPRSADIPVNPSFTPYIQNPRFPWLGPAQYFLHYYPQLPKLLRRLKPDIVDLWEEPWGLVSAHVCRLRNRHWPAMKVVAETEQNLSKKLPFPFERFRRYTLTHADFLVGRSAEAVAVARQKGYAGRAEVVPNAVDTSLFRPLDRDACRRSLNLSGFVAGYAGRFVPQKGLLDLIDALPLCPPDTRLLFVGSGPLEPELRQRARELNVSDRLTILPNRPLEQLPEFMNAIDTFVLPSRTTHRWKEQFGRVIIEANACGTPVIGTNSGAIPDVIGDAGLIVPEKNPAALAAAITRLHNHPDEARALAAAALARTHWYTWQRVAERMATIYQTITDTPSS